MVQFVAVFATLVIGAPITGLAKTEIISKSSIISSVF